MAKCSSKKEVSLFDTTPATTTPATTATPAPTPATPATKGQMCVDLYQKLKTLLSYTDENLVAKSEQTVCDITKTLLTYVKTCFTEAVEALSASMAQDSDMTQAQAIDTVMSLVGDKTGYDKLETQLYICAYSSLLVQVNAYMRQGFQCFLAIAKACYDANVQYLPASVRTLFNACIVYQKKDDTGFMKWVFWTPACRTRNAVATHSIAQGCFIRSNGLEHLFTPSMSHVELETRESPNTRGELVNKPVIEYQWDSKSQRILTFWKSIGVGEDVWEKTLAQYDEEAAEHIVTYKTACEEKLAKASTKGALKGLETTKKAPNAVKVRNAKLKQLFEDMDF